MKRNKMRPRFTRVDLPEEQLEEIDMEVAREITRLAKKHSEAFFCTNGVYPLKVLLTKLTNTNKTVLLYTAKEYNNYHKTTINQDDFVLQVKETSQDLEADQFLCCAYCVSRGQFFDTRVTLPELKKDKRTELALRQARRNNIVITQDANFVYNTRSNKLEVL